MFFFFFNGLENYTVIPQLLEDAGIIKVQGLESIATDVRESYTTQSVEFTYLYQKGSRQQRKRVILNTVMISGS